MSAPDVTDDPGGPVSATEASPAARSSVPIDAVVERLNALDDKGQLGALFGPAKDDARRELVEREEGWILGAPV